MEAERALDIAEADRLESELQRLSAFDAAKAQEDAREAALAAALKQECDVVCVEQSSMAKKMASYSVAVKMLGVRVTYRSKSKSAPGAGRDAVRRDNVRELEVRQKEFQAQSEKCALETAVYSRMMEDGIELFCELVKLATILTGFRGHFSALRCDLAHITMDERRLRDGWGSYPKAVEHLDHHLEFVSRMDDMVLKIQSDWQAEKKRLKREREELASCCDRFAGMLRVHAGSLTRLYRGIRERLLPDREQCKDERQGDLDKANGELAAAAEQVSAAKDGVQRAHRTDEDAREELERLVASANERKRLAADDEARSREKQKISGYKKQLKQYPKGGMGINAMREQDNVTKAEGRQKREQDKVECAKRELQGVKEQIKQCHRTLELIAPHPELTGGAATKKLSKIETAHFRGAYLAGQFKQAVLMSQSNIWLSLLEFGASFDLENPLVQQLLHRNAADRAFAEGTPPPSFTSELGTVLVGALRPLEEIPAKSKLVEAAAPGSLSLAQLIKAATAEPSALRIMIHGKPCGLRGTQAQDARQALELGVSHQGFSLSPDGRFYYVALDGTVSPVIIDSAGGSNGGGGGGGGVGGGGCGSGGASALRHRAVLRWQRMRTSMGFAGKGIVQVAAQMQDLDFKSGPPGFATVADAMMYLHELALCRGGSRSLSYEGEQQTALASSRRKAQQQVQDELEKFVGDGKLEKIVGIKAQYDREEGQRRAEEQKKQEIAEKKQEIADLAMQAKLDEAFAVAQKAAAAKKASEKEEAAKAASKRPWMAVDGVTGDLDWEKKDGYRSARLPDAHPMHSAIARFVIEDGGKRGRRARLRISSIELLWNDLLASQFDIGVQVMEQTYENPFFRQNVPDDGQKHKLLKRLKTWGESSARTLEEQIGRPQLKHTQVLLAAHGCGEPVVPSICKNGAKDLRKTDNGYAGAGIYATRQAEYAEAYAAGAGEHVMFIWWVAVGQTYPISRRTDYPNKGARYESMCHFYDGVS